MANRVYVHAGLPKTGTTFLQTTLWHNRRKLRAQGFLYPGRARLDHYDAHHDIRRTTAREVREDGAWAQLIKPLAGFDGNGLISHEFFSLCTRNQVARVVAELAPAEVHVVVTVRDYVRQWPAVWQEAQKVRSHDSSFDEFMAAAFEGGPGAPKGAWSWDSQDVEKVLARWSSAVPPERIHVVTVPGPGAPRDLLWRRFCQVLGIDDTGFDLDVHYPNESLGAPQAALVRKVNEQLSGELLDGAVRHRWVRRYFGHEVLVPQKGPRFAPREQYVDLLRARAAQAARSIEEGGYDVVGDLAELTSGEVGAGPHPDDVTDAELLETATRAIEQMIRDMREMTMERDRWRARARRAAGGGRFSRVVRRIRDRRGAAADQPDEPDHEEVA